MLQNQNISFALSSESCSCSWWTEGALSRWRALLINLEDVDGRYLLSGISKYIKTHERKWTSDISQVVWWIREINTSSAFELSWGRLTRWWKITRWCNNKRHVRTSSWDSGRLWGDCTIHMGGSGKPAGSSACLRRIFGSSMLTSSIEILLKDEKSKIDKHLARLTMKIIRFGVEHSNCVIVSHSCYCHC